jgi:hypothetical protein
MPLVRKFEPVEEREYASMGKPQRELAGDRLPGEHADRILHERGVAQALRQLAVLEHGRDSRPTTRLRRARRARRRARRRAPRSTGASARRRPSPPSPRCSPTSSSRAGWPLRRASMAPAATGASAVFGRAAYGAKSSKTRSSRGPLRVAGAFGRLLQRHLPGCGSEIVHRRNPRRETGWSPTHDRSGGVECGSTSRRWPVQKFLCRTTLSRRLPTTRTATPLRVSRRRDVVAGIGAQVDVAFDLNPFWSDVVVQHHLRGGAPSAPAENRLQPAVTGCKRLLDCQVA